MRFDRNAETCSDIDHFCERRLHGVPGGRLGHHRVEFAGLQNEAIDVGQFESGRRLDHHAGASGGAKFHHTVLQPVEAGLQLLAGRRRPAVPTRIQCLDEHGDLVGGRRGPGRRGPLPDQNQSHRRGQHRGRGQGRNPPKPVGPQERHGSGGLAGTDKGQAHQGFGGLGIVGVEILSSRFEFDQVFGLRVMPADAAGGASKRHIHRRPLDETPLQVIVAFEHPAQFIAFVARQLTVEVFFNQQKKAFEALDFFRIDVHACSPAERRF